MAYPNLPRRRLFLIAQGKSKDKGTTVMVRGFWGDIINSPYWAFGVDTHPKDKERLFKVSSQQ